MNKSTDVIHAIPCYVFMTRTYDWSSGRTKEIWKPAVYSFKPADEASSLFISQMVINVAIPQDWSPVVSQIAALDQLEKTTTEEYLRKRDSIRQEKNKLLALTLSPTSGCVE